MGRVKHLDRYTTILVGQINNWVGPFPTNLQTKNQLVKVSTINVILTLYHVPELFAYYTTIHFYCKGLFVLVTQM